MKKIINGKVYDTATARCIGGICYGLSDRLYGWSEDLYCKRTGEYFLHGEGGPGSKYSEPAGPSETRGSERIYPLSYDDARAWAAQHLTADEYTAEFGEITEGDASVRLNLYMSASTIERARREAAKAGITISAYIESAIKRDLGD